MHILRVLVTITFEDKIGINICKPHYVNLFFRNLLHSPYFWLFDFWYLFDNFDIFLTIWHLFDKLTHYVNLLSLSDPDGGLGWWGTLVTEYMSNGACGQWGAWVKTWCIQPDMVLGSWVCSLFKTASNNLKLTKKRNLKQTSCKCLQHLLFPDGYPSKY